MAKPTQNSVYDFDDSDKGIGTSSYIPEQKDANSGLYSWADKEDWGKTDNEGNPITPSNRSKADNEYKTNLDADNVRKGTETGWKDADGNEITYNQIQDYDLSKNEGLKTFDDLEGNETTIGQWDSIDDYNREKYGFNKDTDEDYTDEEWDKKLKLADYGDRDYYAEFLLHGGTGDDEGQGSWNAMLEGEGYTDKDHEGNNILRLFGDSWVSKESQDSQYSDQGGKEIGIEISPLDWKLMEKHGVEPYGDRNYEKGGPALWLQGEGAKDKISAKDYYEKALHESRLKESDELIKRAKESGIYDVILKNNPNLGENLGLYTEDMRGTDPLMSFNYNQTLNHIRRDIVGEEEDNEYPDVVQPKSPSILDKVKNLFSKD